MRARPTRVAALALVLIALASCGLGGGRVGVEGGADSSGPGAATLPPSAAPSLGGPPAPSPATPTPVVGPASRGSPPPSTSPRPARPAGTANPGPAVGIELFDAHIHYSSDAWAQYPPEHAIEILRDAGIRRALVSSTPDTGTQRLYALAPDLVVPILRPYRTRDDIGGWTRDGTIVAYVEGAYRRGVHRGIGEFHIGPGDSATPVVRAIVALAVREDLWLHAHADERAVAELAASDRRAKVLWAHAGLSSSPQAVRAVLESNPNVVAELALRGDVMSGETIDPVWREIFLRFPDRFMVGTDTWVPSRWEAVVSGHERTRAWLRQLPPDVAERIASGNAEQLFGTPR
jgi:hypothetical protein